VEQKKHNNSEQTFSQKVKKLENKVQVLEVQLKKIKSNNETNNNVKEVRLKKSKFDYFTSITAMILTIVTIGLSLFVFFTQHNFNRRNQTLILREEIDVEHIGRSSDDLSYEITLIAEQGGIVSAMLVNFNENDVFHSQLRHGTIQRNRVAFRVEAIWTPESELPEEEGVQRWVRVHNIIEFALVIQDTRSEWHVFYLIIRPAIDSTSYTITRIDSGEEVSISYQDKDFLILSTRLINLSTVERRIEEFLENNNEFTLAVGTTFRTVAKIDFLMSSPELVFNRMRQITRDINQSWKD